MSRCRACGAEIEWIRTKAGKNMPCDIRKVTIVTEEGDVVTGYNPHWSTCPEADKFRKAKGRE